MLAPTTPANPAQRIDQTYGPNGLVEEIVWTWPPDGTGVRRRDGLPDEPVTGLPIPETPAPSDAEKLAALLAALADAETLGDVRAAAAAVGGA